MNIDPTIPHGYSPPREFRPLDMLIGWVGGVATVVVLIGIAKLTAWAFFS